MTNQDEVAIQRAVERAAQLFGCSIQQIKAQYAANAIELDQMHNKAILTGKKVNGFTAEYLKEKVAEFRQKAA